MSFTHLSAADGLSSAIYLAAASNLSSAKGDQITFNV